MAASPKFDKSENFINEAEPRVERPHRRFPKEGENDLYSQSGYPLCMSDELRSGEVIGREFLNGRVVVLRGEDRESAVLSPYCASWHGSAQGKVVGNNLQCLFHRIDLVQLRGYRPGKKQRVIPSPGRSKSPRWVYDTVPLIPPKPGAVASTAQASGP